MTGMEGRETNSLVQMEFYPLEKKVYLNEGNAFQFGDFFEKGFLLIKVLLSWVCRDEYLMLLKVIIEFLISSFSKNLFE